MLSAGQESNCCPCQVSKDILHGFLFNHCFDWYMERERERERERMGNLLGLNCRITLLAWQLRSVGWIIYATKFNQLRTPRECTLLMRSLVCHCSAVGTFEFIFLSMRIAHYSRGVFFSFQSFVLTSKEQPRWSMPHCRSRRLHSWIMWFTIWTKDKGKEADEKWNSITTAY